MAYDLQIVIDSGDPHALADWWADALGGDVEPRDPAFIRSMVAAGYATEDQTSTHRGLLVWISGAAIRHPEGLQRAPRILFQQVPETKTVKNRVHLDLRIGTDDVQQSVDRLTARGATFLHAGQQGPHTWLTIAGPEGNELCVSQ